MGLHIPSAARLPSCRGAFWLLVSLLALVGCAGDAVQPRADLPLAPAQGISQGISPDTERALSFSEQHWKPYVLPGKRATQYVLTTKEGRPALQARADRSASMMRHRLEAAPAQWSELSWSWWVDSVLADADLADVDRTDSPASIVLAFEGDKSRLSARARMMFDLARAVSGEEPPYATLVYAWATHTPVETVIHNPRTDRVRKIVVESGDVPLRRWRQYRRNVVEDFRRAFGEEPGRLVGVGVMTDSDNTGSRAVAWYGPIRLHRGQAATEAGTDTSGAVQSSKRSVANN